MKKYGRKLYIRNPLNEKKFGNYICPICNKNSILVERKGYGFMILASICNEGHRVNLAKQLYPKFEIGDTVRIYGSTFGKDAVIRTDCYDEGIIVESYNSIIDCEFDMLITKAVMNGKQLPSNSWRYGTIIHGHRHHARDVDIVKKVEKVNYEQLSLLI